MGSPQSRKAGPSLGEAALDRRGMLRPRRCHKAGPAEPPRCPQGCDTQLPTLQGEKSHTSHRNAHSEHQAKGVKLFTVSSLSLFFFFFPLFSLNTHRILVCGKAESCLPPGGTSSCSDRVPNNSSKAGQFSLLPPS